MKRFLTLIAIVAAIFSTLFTCKGSEEHRRLVQLSRVLDADLSAGALARYEDDHGGFHGDGETFAEVKLDGLAETLAGAPGWRPLPMPENVARAVCLTGREDVAEAFSGIEEGLYYFYDRHSESTDPCNDAGLHNRASWNFTVAAYDGETGRLYFYELDT